MLYSLKLFYFLVIFAFSLLSIIISYGMLMNMHLMSNRHYKNMAATHSQDTKGSHHQSPLAPLPMQKKHQSKKGHKRSLLLQQMSSRFPKTTPTKMPNRPLLKQSKLLHPSKRHNATIKHRKNQQYQLKHLRSTTMDSFIRKRHVNPKKSF